MRNVLGLDNDNGSSKEVLETSAHKVGPLGGRMWAADNNIHWAV